MDGGQTFTVGAASRATRPIPAVAPARTVRPDRRDDHLGGLLQRCVRSWEAAGASLLAFLDDWSPLTFSEPAPTPARRPDTRRRKPARRTPLAARRPPRIPARSVNDPLADGQTVAGVDSRELRRHFPYIAELLIEMAATPTPPRASQRRS